jgi:hypothetical protein
LLSMIAAAAEQTAPNGGAKSHRKFAARRS